jgi:hypothetical protein
MIRDVQDFVCQILFKGYVPGYTRDDWMNCNGNGQVLKLRVDHNRAKASRVSKLWHKHFREWLEKETEAEAQRSWCRGINIGLQMADFVDVDFHLYNDEYAEFAQYSLWLNKKPLVAVGVELRPGKGKKKKGVCELVLLYSLQAEYRRMRGVKKTAAKKQGKEWKKRIFGVADEVFVHPEQRTPEQVQTLAVWKNTIRNDMLDWCREQHAGMRAKF